MIGGLQGEFGDLDIKYLNQVQLDSSISFSNLLTYKISLGEYSAIFKKH